MTELKKPKLEDWSTYEEAIAMAMREGFTRKQAIELIKQFGKERPESCIFDKDMH